MCVFVGISLGLSVIALGIILVGLLRPDKDKPPEGPDVDDLHP